MDRLELDEHDEVDKFPPEAAEIVLDKLGVGVITKVVVPATPVVVEEDSVYPEVLTDRPEAVPEVVKVEEVEFANPTLNVSVVGLKSV